MRNLVEVGPFILQRRVRGATAYKTRARGWSPNRDAAWKFDTEAAARFALRNSEGEVVPLDPAPPQSNLNGMFAKGPPVTVAAATIMAAAPAAPLSPAERTLLAANEEVVRRGLKGFLETSRALLAIRDLRLYRERFKRFEDYMEAEFGLSARHGHRLCDAAEVVQNLLPAPNYEWDQEPPNGNGNGNGNGQTGILPQTESQARPLKALKPELRGVAWREAVKEAGGKQPTARQVSEAVEKAKPRAVVPHAKDAEDAKGDEARRAAKNRPKRPCSICTLEVQWSQPSVLSGKEWQHVSCRQEEDRLKAAAVPHAKDAKDAKGNRALEGASSYSVEQWQRKRVLAAAQRAVVAIRALQDLLMGNKPAIGHCNAAVFRVEQIEAGLRAPGENGKAKLQAMASKRREARI